jgi:hypothetical protein
MTNASIGRAASAARLSALSTLCAALLGACTSAQGPAGTKGDTGPVPSQAEIQLAVSAMTNLDVPTLAGRPAAGYLKTSDWGRFLEAESPAMASLATAGVPSSLAAADAASASGGGGVRGRYNEPTGVMAGLDMTTLAGEPIAQGTVLVEFRLMVTTAASSSTIGRLSCDGLRADGATTFSSASDIQPRHFRANATWQIFGLTCPFLPDDVAQSVKVEFTANNVTDLSLDHVRMTPAPNPCPTGWWSIAGGRICMESVVETAATMYGAAGALATCNAKEARVCTHSDYQRACGAGYAAFGPTSGWYGDHGGADDTFHVWNGAACTTNNDGTPAAAASTSLPYRCCW